MVSSAKLCQNPLVKEVNLYWSATLVICRDFTRRIAKLNAIMESQTNIRNVERLSTDDRNRVSDFSYRCANMLEEMIATEKHRKEAVEADKSDKN